MIASGYSLHLYCCCEHCAANGGMRKFSGGFGEYGEPTKTLTLRAARRDGWRIDYKGNRCWAPGHTQRPTDKPAF